MGQEQSGLSRLEYPNEEYDPPILQDKDHKQLEEKATRVLTETKIDNSCSRHAAQAERRPGDDSNRDGE